MAVNFLNSIDLNNNQLLNARVHVNGSAPAGAGKGSIWLNSSTNELNFHNGTTFVSVLDDTTIANTQNVFTTSFVDSTNDVLLRLTKSGAASGTQDIKFVAGSNITLSPDGVNMTIASAQKPDGTIRGLFSASGVLSYNNSTGAFTSSAQANVATDLSKTTTTSNVTVISSTGSNIALGAASTSAAGVMTKATFDAVTANTAKTGITSGQASAITANTAKTGITSGQASAITANTAKVTNTDVDVSVGNLETRLGQINSNITIGNASSVNTTISGDLIVNGDTTTVTSTTVAIGDNMMLMAKDNTANSKDIGWYGKIVAEGAKYPSMFYDASSGVAVPTFQVGLATTEPGSATSTIAVKGTINANLTGDVSGSAGTVSSIGNLTGDVTSSNRATTIANDAVTLAKMQNISTSKILGRTTSSTGNVEQLSGATVKTMLAVNNVTNESKATMFTSAALTGNSTAITQSAGDNSTKIATTAFVTTATSLIGKVTKKLVGVDNQLTYTVTHGFGTPHVIVQLLDYGNNGSGATYDIVYTDVKRSSDNAVTVVFGNTTVVSNTQDYLVLITKMPSIS